jgi:hypothetical protein
VTKEKALSEADALIRGPLAEALAEMDENGVTYLIAEVRRPLLTQCLYALQGRFRVQEELEWACKAAGIRPPGKGVVTWTLKSKHLAGRAVDIVPVRDGTLLWDYTGNRAAYGAIAAVMIKHGFAWGGDWETPDYPHYEM